MQCLKNFISINNPDNLYKHKLCDRISQVWKITRHDSALRGSIIALHV